MYNKTKKTDHGYDVLYKIGRNVAELQRCDLLGAFRPIMYCIEKASTVRFNDYDGATLGAHSPACLYLKNIFYYVRSEIVKIQGKVALGLSSFEIQGNEQILMWAVKTAITT